ncbi:hypothetical protein PVK06_033813 [Gossypium arboreum]|uniref:Transposase MuDR plant domain-containing protein n=1 Tax=Gossypium arboreum TaxID=29729 RepID=A0ABR0NCG7_GOSAR|nr:hypothetical protein PVK06_033813 [Gossypium arboreum]
MYKYSIVPFNGNELRVPPVDLLLHSSHTSLRRVYPGCGEGVDPTCEGREEFLRECKGVEEAEEDRDVRQYDIPIEIVLDDLILEIKKRRASVNTTTVGESSGVGSAADYLESLDLVSSDIDEDGDVVFKKSEKCYFDLTNLMPHFQLGLILESPKQFKSALKRYAIAKRFDFKLAKNEKDKTKAVCKWRVLLFTVYVGVDSMDELFNIQAFRNHHTCSITFKNSRAL